MTDNIPQGWRKVTLGDVVLFNPNEKLKKGNLAKKVAMENIQPYTREIKNFKLEEYKGGSKFRNGDTLLARITPCLENGKCAFVNILKKDEIAFGSTEYIVFRELKNTTISKFIYYLVCSPLIREPAIKSMVGSSGRQRVQEDVIKNLEINLPPLEVQKKIAGVLSCLDDKIELNNKINQNLEQQALGLYNEYILSKNYEQKPLGNYCSVKSGFAFKSSWWTDKGTKVIKIKNIENDKLNIQECSFVSADKIHKASEFVVKGGDVLIAMTGATIGKFAIVPQTKDTLLVNQRVGKFFIGNNPIEKLPFLYCTLKQNKISSEIINRGQGSAQPNISGTDIMSIECVFPPENQICKFNEICSPLFMKIISNMEQNERLAEIRDALLPKLMSGELPVDNVNVVNVIARNDMTKQS